VLFAFSPELIQEAIRVFREEDGIELSQEQAVDALNAFADLFLAFAGEGAGRDRPTVRPAANTIAKPRRMASLSRLTDALQSNPA